MATELPRHSPGSKETPTLMAARDIHRPVTAPGESRTFGQPPDISECGIGLHPRGHALPKGDSE